MCRYGTYSGSRHFKPVAEHAAPSKEVEHVSYEKGVENGCREFDMSEVSRTGKVGEVTC